MENHFDLIKIGAYGLNGKENAITLKGKHVGGLISKHNILLCDSIMFASNLDVHTVYAVHVTTDITVPDSNGFLQKLVRIPFKNFETRIYRNTANGEVQSIVIMSKFRKHKGGRKTYLTIYDKYVESQNEVFKNVIRLEQKISTFEDLRTGFQVKENNLYNILHATVNPIKSTLAKIAENIDSKIELDLVSTDLNMRLHEAYFEKFKYDFNLIQQDLKKSGITKYRLQKAYEIFLAIVIQRDTLDHRSIFNQLLN